MKNKFILSLLLILYLIMCNEVFGQADALSHSRVTGQYVGWDATGTAGSLDVANGTSNPIDFYINGGPWVQFLPSGDVNVVQGTDGYMINSIYVLRHNDNVSNIFVGVNAGNTNAIDNNVFVGYNAGVNTGDGGLDGYSNTFVGYAAGPSNDFGYQNSFFGDSSGFTNYDGYHNTFIGYKAGFENFTGNSSVFVGADAGHSSTNNYNTMVGRNCG